MMRRVLLIRTDRMGDLLMTLPAVHSVRQGLPEAEITLLVQKGLEPLLEGHPDVDRLWIWDPAEGQGWRAILRSAVRLRAGRFDAAVVFNPTKLFHWACFLAGIPVRVGYRRKAGMLLTASILDTKAQRNRHESDYNLELAGRLGIPAGKTALALPEREAIARQAKELLQAHGLLDHAGGLVAVHPWTSNPAKGWPLDSFWKLAGELQRRGRAVVVIGGAEAVPQMESSIPALPPSVRNLVGQVPLGLLPSFLRRCALLISNDSGPIHVAAAVGTPVVAVAPRSHARLFERWRPLGKCTLLLDPEVREAAEAVQRQLNDVQVRIPSV